MPPIYIDIDDVLADTSRSLIDIAESDFDKKVPFEKLTSFDLQVSFNLSRGEYKRLMEVAHRPDQILGLEPVHEAIEALQQWVVSGYEISIVTGRPTATHATTLEWLAMHKIPFDHFFMVDKYSRPGMDTDIALSMQALSEMKFCFAIEDSYDMAVHIADKMDTPVFLFDRPWNRSPNLNNRIKRFRSWKELQHI